MSEKRKKVRENTDFASKISELNKVYDENKQTIEKIRNLLSPIDELIKAREKFQTIPISVFNDKLSSLETISKYLKENICLNYHEIAVLTGRDERNIWQSYHAAAKKYSNRFELKESKISIPVSILKNTKLSILEVIVQYLKKTHNLRYSEISGLLHRDTRTIWTVYKRALQKNESE